jgi:hypothetical protein
MTEAQFVWDHFKFNAEQRIKCFNFFVLLTIFADGGVFTAIEKSLNPVILSLLGVFTFILTTVFWLVDTRSQKLLRLAIPALKEIEAEFKPSAQLFRIDAQEQGKIVRYTFAFRTLLSCQLVFGFGVFIYGLSLL